MSSRRSMAMGRPSSPYRISVSTIADLGRTLTSEEQRIYEDQLELTRRRHYKNVKGGSEAVWPPHLEAVLIQGLYRYVKEYGELGARAVPRNHFLYNFIFAMTNQKRTRKQIASRLQQLGTSSDTRVKDLVRGSLSSSTSMTSPLTHSPNLSSTAPEPTASNWHGRTMRIPVTISARSAPFPSSPPSITIQSRPNSISLRTYAEWAPHTTAVRGMDSTVTLISPLRLASLSDFLVTRNGRAYETLRDENALVPTGINAGQWRYTASIAGSGRWWKQICDDDDETYVKKSRRAEWIILQTIFGEADSRRQCPPVAKFLYSFEPIGRSMPQRNPPSQRAELKIKQESSEGYMIWEPQSGLSNESLGAF
ncbi:hypothetical protein FB45DRAFT_902080 [Roridomyces roridus]|uniref:TEA domain-containing protein n=1 Tax=Roridomyces roridus TaxID=1738132 RepID=A0AAD7C922_9AGAR|nr:hypothetical protein FB45DRAFT_902080 [Roridomyces roridus]